MIVPDYETPSDYHDAINIQKELAKKISLGSLKNRLRSIAGVDVAYDTEKKIACSSVVLVENGTFKMLEFQCGYSSSYFPYIPGLLSFRELPAILNAFEKLKSVPDLVICDGQGIAHPRGLGLGAHLGVILHIPTIGCAKSRLVGKYNKLSIEKGSKVPLVFNGKRIGSVLRTRKNVKPLFISPGNLITFDEADEIIFNCVTKYRLPEPVRLAHKMADKCKKALKRSKNDKEIILE